MRTRMFQWEFCRSHSKDVWTEFIRVLGGRPFLWRSWEDRKLKKSPHKFVLSWKEFFGVCLLRGEYFLGKFYWNFHDFSRNFLELKLHIKMVQEGENRSSLGSTTRPEPIFSVSSIAMTMIMIVAQTQRIKGCEICRDEIEWKSNKSEVSLSVSLVLPSPHITSQVCTEEKKSFSFIFFIIQKNYHNHHHLKTLDSLCFSIVCDAHESKWNSNQEQQKKEFSIVFPRVRGRKNEIEVDKSEKKNIRIIHFCADGDEDPENVETTSNYFQTIAIRSHSRNENNSLLSSSSLSHLIIVRAWTQISRLNAAIFPLLIFLTLKNRETNFQLKNFQFSKVFHSLQNSGWKNFHFSQSQWNMRSWKLNSQHPLYRQRRLPFATFQPHIVHSQSLWRRKSSVKLHKMWAFFANSPNFTIERVELKVFPFFFCRSK